MKLVQIYLNIFNKMTIISNFFPSWIRIRIQYYPLPFPHFLFLLFLLSCRSPCDQPGAPDLAHDRPAGRPVRQEYFWKQCFGSGFGIQIQGVKKRFKMLNHHKIILFFTTLNLSGLKTHKLIERYRYLSINFFFGQYSIKKLFFPGIVKKQLESWSGFRFLAG